MVNIILQHTTCVLTSLLLTSKDGVFYMYVCVCDACRSETY